MVRRGPVEVPRLTRVYHRLCSGASTVTLGGSTLGGIVIPVPARVVAACALVVAGAFTINGVAFTVSLFTMAVFFVVWAVLERPGAGGD